MVHFSVLLFSTLPLSGLVGLFARRWAWTQTPPVWVVLLITGFTGVLVVFADCVLRPVGVYTQEGWLLATIVMAGLCPLFAYCTMSVVVFLVTNAQRRSETPAGNEYRLIYSNSRKHWYARQRNERRKNW